MSDNISLEQLNNELDFFHKMYDLVRLVDPVHKKVLDYRGSSIQSTNNFCYNYWGNGKICDNCISMRAFNENKSFVKIENDDSKFYMVTAIPVDNIHPPVVLELMKDATSSMFVGYGDYNTNETLQDFMHKINEMIIKDSITDLYNRRFVSERLPVDIVNATLKKQPLSLCYLDLDNFKMINDTYGHEVGDCVIREVSHVITSCMRNDTDWASRQGGDEFLLCFNNTTKDQVKSIMERIRLKIEKIPSSLNFNSTLFSISYGIVTTVDSRLTADEFIMLADREMYKHKKSK